MNRSQNAMLATAAAAVTALLLVGILFYTVLSGSENPGITLPPGPSELQVPTTAAGDVTGANPLAPNLIEITAGNVTTIVADLSRPAEYSAVNRTTRYWDGGESSAIHNVYVIDECIRVDETDADGDVVFTVIYTPETVYLPLAGSQDQPVARGDFDPDTAASMPTYEDVLKLDAEAITGAKYVIRNARPCVWVQTLDGQGYETDYWIDLEYGLLTYAEARQGGQLAWAFEQTELTLERPGAGKFELPSGASALTQKQQG